MNDKIVQKVVDKILLRSAVGQNKYNITMDRTDLSLSEWVNHAQEEAMDLVIYLEKIKTILNDREKHTES